MNRLALAALLFTAACTTTPPVTAPPAPEVRPVVAKVELQARWTVEVVNGASTRGLWLELGGEGPADITRRADGGWNIGGPQPVTRANLGCNEMRASGWTRAGDTLSLAYPLSTTERGCDPPVNAVEQQILAILRKPMTVALTPPDRLRLANAAGTLDLVRVAVPAAISYRAVGTEPFWSLTLDGRKMVWTEANAPGQRIVEPQPKVIIGFAGEIYQSPRIGVNIVHTPCSDGMSDRTYPDKVQLRIDNRSFEGCGGEPVGER